MTRASLLDILDHVGRISEAEIRELEQLATTFPYCQTAHVLLAKAAHDRGSMLASQRLRRAATYAADRQLLRQLLEQPAPEPAGLLESSAVAVQPAAIAPAALPAAGSATAFFQTLGPEDVQPLETDTSASVEDEAPGVPAAEPPAADAAPEAPETALADSEAAILSQPVSPERAAEPANAGLLAPVSTEASAAASANPQAALAADQTPADLPESSPASLASQEVELAAPPETPAPEETPVAASEHQATAAAPSETPVATPSEQPSAAVLPDVLPATAPRIRPPAEAGISRFEFGLGEPAAPAAATLYQLPGAEDEDETAPVASPALPPFHSDAELAYALLGGGSRMGYALQLQEGELTSALPHDEFFAPDALLHAHAKAHQPPAAPAPSSLDLINRFLKNQPRLKSPAVRLSLAEEQTDLSVRSTSGAPQLASESLAKIMVRQGKIDKAIEIYERLMVRQPEKSAYFADQIQQLQTPE